LRAKYAPPCLFRFVSPPPSRSILNSPCARCQLSLDHLCKLPSGGASATNSTTILQNQGPDSQGTRDKAGVREGSWIYVCAQNQSKGHRASHPNPAGQILPLSGRPVRTMKFLWLRAPPSHCNRYRYGLVSFRLWPYVLSQQRGCEKSSIRRPNLPRALVGCCQSFSEMKLTWRSLARLYCI